MRKWHADLGSASKIRHQRNISNAGIAWRSLMRKQRHHQRSNQAKEQQAAAAKNGGNSIVALASIKRSKCAPVRKISVASRKIKSGNKQKRLYRVSMNMLACVKQLYKQRARCILAHKQQHISIVRWQNVCSAHPAAHNNRACHGALHGNKQQSACMYAQQRHQSVASA